MNIVMREMRANVRSLCIWSLGMVVLVVMQFAEFSAYYKNPEMLAVIEAMPRAMLEAFGMADANLTTVSGFVSVTVPFINLALGIFAFLLGNGTIAKEERDRTAGFLMTLPVSRRRVLTGKLLAAIAGCAALLLAVMGSVIVAVLPYQWEAAFPEFLVLVTGAAFVFSLFFLSLGMLSAAVIRRYKLSAGMGVWLVFGLYVASILAALTEEMAFLRWVTPFSYFEGAELLRNLSLDPTYLGISAAVIAASLAATYLVYERRDLYV
jgi:ABC-2 type transport system permease protein